MEWTVELFYFAFVIITYMAIYHNHIDDTDAVYGYYEPLHYILFGKGMQTWEYSPQFAIRSYAYLHPFKLFSI